MSSGGSRTAFLKAGMMLSCSHRGLMDPLLLSWDSGESGSNAGPLATPGIAVLAL